MIKEDDFELSVEAHELYRKTSVMDKVAIEITAQVIKRNLEKPPDPRTEDETIRDYVKDLNNNKWLDAKTNYEKYLIGQALSIYLFLLRRFKEPAPYRSKYNWIMDEKYIDLYFNVKKKIKEEKQNNKYYVKS